MSETKNAQYQREWYERNKEKKKAQSVVNRQKAVARNRDFVRFVKESNPCTDCRQTYPYYVMDFDHLSDKVRGVSVLMNQGVSLNKILEEIEKCELVCSNCHRVRTFKRGKVLREIL